MLRPALVPVVKTDPIDSNVYDLRTRSCTNESYQNSKLEGSYSTMHLVDILHIDVILDTAFGLVLSLLDAVDAFQSTILLKEKIPHVHLPPFCIE